MPHYDSKHWRECAEEARTMADGVVDLGAKKTMTAIADAYDEMARNAEQHGVTASSAPKP